MGRACGAPTAGGPTAQILRQHALEHRVAFDESMVERASDMKRDKRSDHDPADEMPDKYPVGQWLILAQNGGKVEQAKDADRIAVRVGPRPAEHGYDEEQGIERILRPERGALLDGGHGRVRRRRAERLAPYKSRDHDDQDKRPQRLMEVIEIVSERAFGHEPLHHRAYNEQGDDCRGDEPVHELRRGRITQRPVASIRQRRHDALPSG